ncbi:MAG: branched-chain amino acid ABC transporter permease [Thermoleophilia bacterium]|nr:branched-chain amino acid ABC transporter permease [Thermoleophilia bacterium]
MSRVARPLAAFAALAIAIALAPLALSDFQAQQAAYVAVYLIALLGLNVLTGYTGQISLGHGAFMAVGGYTTAILMTDAGLRDVWTIPLAGLLTGAAGFLFGLPALRLTGLYLALATFSVALAVPAILKKWESLTGGSSGILLFSEDTLTAALRPISILGLELDFNNWLYALCWTVAFVLYVAAWLGLRGRTGRAFRAIRDSEVAAVMAGISPARAKTLAFAVSSFYAGAAGSLFAIANAGVGPTNYPVTLSIVLVVGVVVSGLGSLTGAIAGAVLIQFLPIWAQDVSRSPGLPGVVYGLVVIAAVFLLPGGVSGLLELLERLVRGARNSLTPGGYDPDAGDHTRSQERPIR